MIDYYVYEERKLVGGVWGPWRQMDITPDLTIEVIVPDDATEVQYRAKAVDDQGAEGPYITGPAKVIDYNASPIISGENIDLGTVSMTPPAYEYTVDDADEADEVTVTEMLDDNVLRQYVAQKSTTQSVTIPPDLWLFTGNGLHTLVIYASDGKETTTRTITFTRRNKRFRAITAQATLGRATAVTLTAVPHPSNWPADAVVKFLVSNNAYSPEPIWIEVPFSLINAGWVPLPNMEGEDNELGVGIDIVAEEGNSGLPVNLEMLIIGMQ